MSALSLAFRRALRKVIDEGWELKEIIAMVNEEWEAFYDEDN